MEYSRTFKGEQGAGLEMKVKVECFTEENMREALSLIAQSSHRFYLNVAKVCEGKMESAKPPQEGITSNRPDFVGEPDIKLKEEVEDSLAMSQEKFEEMVQHYLKSAPRCKFAQENGSGSIEKDSAPGCEENQGHPHTILADLPTKIVPVLVETAIDILEVSTQSEYIKFATMLLNEAARCNNIFSHAKDESASNVRNREEESSREAAV